MHEINVLYCFDSKYSKLAAVSIYSLLKYQNKTTHVNLYIMCPPRTREKWRINKIAKGFNANITWATVRENPFKNHPYRRWSPVIFYRLFAWRHFPDVKRMLYLDCDTLVFHDLSELFETSLDNNVIGAVWDNALYTKITHPVVQHVKNFIETYTNRYPYINSGVLLMDMDKMREYYDKFLSTDIPLRYPDQDLINYCLYDKIHYLDSTYNTFCHTPAQKKGRSYSAYDYAIIHFYAAKPYMYTATLKKLFSIFHELAADIDLHQEDFVRHDNKYAKKNYSPRTPVPFLRLGRDGHLRLFGFKIT